MKKYLSIFAVKRNCGLFTVCLQIYLTSYIKNNYFYLDDNFLKKSLFFCILSKVLTAHL